MYKVLRIIGTSAIVLGEFDLEEEALAFFRKYETATGEVVLVKVLWE